MQYNFDEIIDRRDTGSLKWHYSDDTIALWVADMDFKAAAPILSAVEQVMQHGILGYTKPTDALYDSIINWHGSRYDLRLEKQNILFSPGVVPSLALMMNVFTKVGEAVMVNDPIYTPFMSKVEQNGRKLVTSALKEAEGKYHLDLADIEAKIIEHEVKLYLLCNPHNPGGRVWTTAELEALLAICKKHNVAIVSDEIHQDLTLTVHTFTPFLTLAKGYEHNVVSLTSMTKTFNIAGIKGSMIFATDKALIKKISQQQQLNDEYELNLFAYTAMRSAYEHGGEWLEQALSYIEANIELTVQFLNEHLPDIKIMRPEASYLIWLDCSAYSQDDQALYDALRAAKVELNAGIKYGEEGHLKMRLNVACPKAILIEGLNRMHSALSDIT
ncbi:MULTISPECIES: MalY/PatB family protein [unclassified Psychrobacter]|uniref:MalY/PatB family protein n=1 Tax=unclassified Psychrobacter TaxID=196806 RepID=UPI000C34CC1D|nr:MULTISPECIES: MalY/PatB family protein [unclassified Psychrobacter]MBA6245031.1 pyridoxal phosphate-dependent aminotransferase [Psychrobacter sp. Urea-trap-18]MBA6286576.1 pyridoxal phosphate-dependent aminotransferase [Psychrobacter sp. Urea-trap-16]MBA6318587.1 pyridoxal phosphate-dependent aminotransferase [Psychrobacter sp. Urea-trap-20]MBA6334808.1 pyridoxal phosphate-dependent aminotransferase [Psychrobacter sp. Urea-trap-19]PKG61435.1 pyridoxal phosphate-dependent aminotransferase [P